MKKIVFAFAAICLAVSSCKEFQPVFTLKYSEPENKTIITDDPDIIADYDERALDYFGAEKFTSIKALKALYKKHGEPKLIEETLVIRGEVVSSDESGNVYRELYLQDETGAIDFKIGRSSSYDDYKLGQILYINCEDLYVGEYGYKDKDYAGCGQIQLGWVRNTIEDDNGKVLNADDYEIGYIDLEFILRKHVLKGVILDETRRKPNSSITGDQILSYGYDEVVGEKKKPTPFQTILQNDLVGQLVEFKNLSYSNEVFVLFYPNPNLKHTKDEPQNRVFLSKPDKAEVVAGVDYTYGVQWWALTKKRFTDMVKDGCGNEVVADQWDALEVGSGNTHLGAISTTYTDMDFFGEKILYKDLILTYPNSQSVSHYFTYQGSPVAIRTSGYARFADVPLPDAVRNGNATIDVIGILSRYEGSPQITMLDAWLSSDSGKKSILDPKNVK